MLEDQVNAWWRKNLAIVIQNIKHYGHRDNLFMSDVVIALLRHVDGFIAPNFAQKTLKL